MKIFALILAVMTWTVQSKNAVAGSGEYPYGVVAGYSNTYNKGQVRAGDEAVLRLSSLGGINVESVVVYTKSNKSGGAGIFTVQANGQQVATKSGSFEEWEGAYDNSSYHPISLLANAVPNVNELVVSLAGTANSLHIEKYEISYTSLAPHTVTLRKGNSIYARLTEETSGQGVALPILPDTAQWHFIGWSETEIYETHEWPTLFAAGTIYVPQTDCVLWATYAFYPKQETNYMTTLESGEYLYVHKDLNVALCGTPENGIMRRDLVDTENPNLYYQVDFVGTDTAYITHLMTAVPIGYSGTKLSARPSPWLVYHEGEETLFYTIVNSKTYVLWLDCMDEGGNARYAGLKQANIGTSSLRLQCVPSEPSDLYVTCHPEKVQAVKEVESEETLQEIRLMQFGNCELYLVNGRKQLRIK